MFHRERRVGAAGGDEGGGFGLVGGAETVYEFGGAGFALAAGEDAAGDGLGCAARAVGFDNDLAGVLVEAADVDLAAVTIDGRLDAIAGDMIARHLDLREQVGAEPEEHGGVVEVFFAGGDVLVVEHGTDGERAIGEATADEPQHFVDIVHGHVGEDAGALVAFGRRAGVFERGVDLEDAPDGALLHEFAAVAERGVEAALEGEHDGVGEFAIERGAAFDVAGERAGEGLFEQDAVAGSGERHGVRLMMFRGRNNDRGLAEARDYVVGE